jgi:hypothetical protein
MKGNIYKSSGWGAGEADKGKERRSISNGLQWERRSRRRREKQRDKINRKNKKRIIERKKVRKREKG